MCGGFKVLIDSNSLKLSLLKFDNNKKLPKDTKISFTNMYPCSNVAAYDKC